MIVAVLWWLSVAKVVNLDKFGKCDKVERWRGYSGALRALVSLCLEVVKIGVKIGVTNWKIIA